MSIKIPKVVLPENASLDIDPNWCSVCSCPCCKADYWSIGNVIECTAEGCGFTFPANWWGTFSDGWNAGLRAGAGGVKSWAMQERLKNPYYATGWHRADPSLEAWKEKETVDWLAVADVKDIAVLLPLDDTLCRRCGSKKEEGRINRPFALCVRCQSETECRYRCSMMERQCEAGVVFDAIRARRKHRGDSLPCYYQEGTNPISCASRSLISVEDVIREDNEIAARTKLMLLARDVVLSIKAEHKGKDWTGVVECPACSGQLHLSHAAYNGHVHGRCETEGCLSWME